MNSVASDLDMTRGAVSSKVRAAAGALVEQEAKQQKPQGLQVGEFVCTTSGNLASRGVRLLLHTHIDGWPAGTTEQKLALQVH